MSFPDFLDRFEGFVGFLVQLIICGLSVSLHQSLRRRCLLLTAWGSGLGAVMWALPWISDSPSTPGGWYLLKFIGIASDAAWLGGFALLLREFAAQCDRTREPSPP